MTNIPKDKEYYLEDLNITIDGKIFDFRDQEFIIIATANKETDLIKRVRDAFL